MNPQPVSLADELRRLEALESLFYEAFTEDRDAEANADPQTLGERCRKYAPLAAALLAQHAAEQPKLTAGEQICKEILFIMQTYHEQENSAYGIDTPGGLEHMGDVWGLFGKWEAALLTSPVAPPPLKRCKHGEYRGDWCPVCGQPPLAPGDQPPAIEPMEISDDDQAALEEIIAERHAPPTPEAPMGQFAEEATRLATKLLAVPPPQWQYAEIQDLAKRVLTAQQPDKRTVPPNPIIRAMERYNMEVMGCLICQGERKNWCPNHGDGSPAPAPPAQERASDEHECINCFKRWQDGFVPKDGEICSECAEILKPVLATAAKQAKLDVAKMIDETRHDWDERTCTAIVKTIRSERT